MVMVHSLLTASLFLLRRQAASVSRVAQETQEAGVLQGAQGVVDGGVTGALSAGWSQLRARFGGGGGGGAQGSDDDAAAAEAACAAAAATAAAATEPAAAAAAAAAGSSDCAAAEAAAAAQAAALERAASGSAALLASAERAERWRDRVFLAMLAWVVVEDLLGDVCGLSPFPDLDRDGYGGGKSGGIGGQPVMSKESVDVLLRLFGSWCQANLFELLGRKDALVILLGPDKVIFGLVGAVLGGVVVAAAALLRAPQLQVRGG
jgi:hypothetical protein